MAARRSSARRSGRRRRGRPTRRRRARVAFRRRQSSQCAFLAHLTGRS
jgi:hypothetical protein